MSTKKPALTVKAKWVKPEITTFNKKNFIKSSTVSGGFEGNYYKTGS